MQVGAPEGVNLWRSKARQVKFNLRAMHIFIKDAHIVVLARREQVHRVSLPAQLGEIVLLASTGIRDRTGPASSRFSHFKYGLCLGFVFLIWIINHVRIQRRKLFKLYKSTLVAEALLREALPALVPHELLALPLLLFLPVLQHFLVPLLARETAVTRARIQT